MKSINIFLLALMATSLLFSSCNKDYLETKPTNSVSDGTVFTNTKDAKKALNGMYRLLYSQFYSTQSLGGQSGNMLFMDALGEDFVMTGESNRWFLSEYKWISHRIATSTICYYNYLYYFTFVANANMIIASIDNATGPQTEKDAIKGQALAFRGWAYYQMIQLFGERFEKSKANDGLGLPLKTKPELAATPRVSVAEIYTQINSDLDAAGSLLSGSVAARENKSYINNSVVKGLRARVALTQENWTLAAQLAAEARQGYSLMNNTQYRSGFNDYSNPEWMWGFHQQEDQTTYFYSYFAFLAANYNSTNIRTNPKAINSLLFAKISPTDVRYTLWDPTGKDATFPIPPSGSRFPYMNRKFLVANTANSTGDVPVMRAAEMYLIEAEALAKQGGKDVEARQALFSLAKQRDPDYVLSTKSGQDLIDEIMTQRRIELWGEGFRFYDLKRTRTPLDRTNANHNGSLVGIYTMDVNAKEWQFLIPQEEINNTDNVVKQNPL